jgi:CHAT domain-containing protein
MAPVRKLHVAASDALASVPLALLVAKAPPRGADAMRRAHWLIRDTSIDVPVTMAAVGRRSDARKGASFAGIGAPALAGEPEAKIELAGLYRGGTADVRALRELPALPRAASELGQMRDALGGSDGLLLTGAAATEAAVRDADLARYSVVAFATHGLIADQLDGLDEPALVLTPPEAPAPGNDGLLAASEIAGLRLAADWVILSACNTAAGAPQAAPSYTGLAHALLYAGARALLLSHWQVRDDAASRLSVATVRGTASGLDRAAALRRAMLALIADRSVPGGAHPAVGAPFILIGQ